MLRLPYFGVSRLLVDFAFSLDDRSFGSKFTMRSSLLSEDAVMSSFSIVWGKLSSKASLVFVSCLPELWLLGRLLKEVPIVVTT